MQNTTARKTSKKSPRFGKGNATELFAAMMAESAASGLPHRFKTDLTVHDYAFLANHYDGETDFGWILYETGCHLSLKGVKRKTLQSVVDMGPEARFYIGGPDGLRRVSAEQLVSAISR